MRLRVARLTAVWLTVACATVDERVGVTPSCALSWGEAPEAPLVDGGSAMVVRGPQGGWHVLAHARCVGIAPGSADVFDHPDNPLVSWVLLTQDGGWIGGYRDLRMPMDTPEGPARLGETLVVRTETYEEAVGLVLDVVLDLVDRDGVAVRSVVEDVTLVVQPGAIAP